MPRKYLHLFVLWLIAAATLTSGAIAQSISSMNPITGTTAGGTSIVLNGTNFGTVEGSVTLGGASTTIISWTDTQVTFLTPVGVGTSKQLILTRDGGGTATNSFFSYTAPAISSITPASGSTSGGYTITIQGTSFGASGASVSIGGNNAPVTSQTHTQIEATVPVGSGINQPVVVTVGGQSSNSINFSYAAPAISSITPASGSTSGGYTITIQGTSFGASGASVSIGGNNAPVTSQTHTQIEATVPVGSGINQPVVVTVGGQSSNSSNFSYAAPAISSITPASGSTSGGYTITIQGTSFGASGASVSIGGSNAPVTSQTHTQIEATVPVGSGINQPVVVTVGGQSSNSINFSYNAPAISSITPASGSTSGGYTITIQGTSFGASGASVSIGGINAPVTLQTHTQIEATVPVGSGINQPVVVTVGGQSSNSINFSYNAPAISSITPASGSTSGGYTITIQGTSFGASGATVSIGGNNAPVTSQTHTQIEATVPVGSGINQPVVVTVGGQNSNSINFNYNAPAISSITPASGSTAGGYTITIQGTSFGASGASVSIGGSNAPVTSQTHTQIEATVPVGSGINQPVIVTVGGQSSNSINFNYTAPAISSILPASGSTAGGYTITIQGTSFGASGASVSIGGSNAPVTSQTHTQIEATVPVGSGINQPVIVTVGGQSSNSINFNYTAPAISSILPASGSTAGGYTITIQGTSFGASGASVSIGGSNAPVTSQTHTQIEATVPVGSGINQPVVVTVGGQSSNSINFSYNAPAISSITPASGSTAGGYTITIQGTSFGASGASVSIGGSNAPVTSQTHTQIQATVPVGSGINQPVVVTVGGQSSNSINFSYNPPVISSTFPVSLPIAGGTTLQLNGQNFGASGTVLLQGQSLSVVSWSHTAIQATIPPLSTTFTPLLSVQVAGQTSNAIVLNYEAPIDGVAVIAVDGSVTTSTLNIGAGITLSVSFESVTNPGDLNVSIVNLSERQPLPVGLQGVPVADMVFVIEALNGLTFTGGTLVFKYDPALLNGLDESSLTTVYRVTSGNVVTAYPAVVDTVAKTVTVTGVTGFSDWYLSDSDSSVRDWLEFTAK